MADTRKFDLIELHEERRKAKNGYWRDRIDKSIHKICSETAETRSDREKLVMAIRNGDRNAMYKFQERINKRTQDRTYGKDIS